MDEPSRVIVVPADSSQPPMVAEVDARSWTSGVKTLIGAQSIDRAVYDRDAALWLDGNGNVDGLPLNERVTRYVFGHSEAAARNRTDPDRPTYTLHGTVVITGADHDTAPARLFTLFGVEA